jgi:hypothetical protein
MKKSSILLITAIMVISVTRLHAQPIQSPALYSPSAGGARILFGQGNTASSPAIGFYSTAFGSWSDGGGGNGIFRPLANIMAFATSSVERMRISPGGNVGIGTLSQSLVHRLQVDGGNVLIRGKANFAANNDEAYLFLGDQNHYIKSTFGSGITINSRNVSNGIFLQQSTGNVGINTSAPLHKLHVQDGAVMISGAVPGAGGPMILFSDNIAANAYPNGRWGVEYMSAAPSRKSMEGLNFWQPWNPSTGGGGNYFMFLKNDGKIGMGVTDDNSDPNFCATAFPSGYRLYVKDGILTDKVKVAVYCSNNWSDYVFANDYKLKPLEEVEAFVKANKHLPGMLSADQMVKEGNDLGATDAKLLEKIEELTLYLIDMQKEIELLKSDNSSLRLSVSNIKK